MRFGAVSGGAAIGLHLGHVEHVVLLPLRGHPRAAPRHRKLRHRRREDLQRRGGRGGGVRVALQPGGVEGLHVQQLDTVVRLPGHLREQRR